MGSDSEWQSSGDNSSYEISRSGPRTKRRKLTHGRRTKTRYIKREASEPSIVAITLEPLLETLRETTSQEWDDEADLRDSFETVFEHWLPECEEAERKFLQSKAENDETGTMVHPLSSQRARQIYNHSASRSEDDAFSTLLSMKSKLQHRTLRKLVLSQKSSYESHTSLTPIRLPRTTSTANPQVIDALYAIQTTPYESSFLSRLQGLPLRRQDGVIAIDWETRTPWMELMSDIREHHTLLHPERVQALETEAPITYCSLQAHHLPQVHDLLARVFWEGVDVSDALEYSPEKCTVVATYKQLVVGAAFLSSPQETYITYLAVRAGWDNSQIATSMLYHLITRNPRKDITLHVSINNPAMLLYNRFGFKAEEFIVGFYEDYLDPNSPQSKNAFRLRLRR
ncbi:hypothetical protein GY45DRAFT_1345172 [Cubamyces sp. BRFM 1775]|nr:hypothetical protein GY45DRAFT_1345172 [Cubamyces sp. BRFM 1775]